MSIFSSVKKANFAVKACAAAGLNFDKAFEANDENAIKAHIDAAVAAAPARDNPEHERLLSDAVTENTKLTANLAACSAVISGAGLKLEDCVDEKGGFSAEKFKAAHSIVIAKAARQMIAAGGHSPIDETPRQDGSKPSAKKTATYAEFQAMAPKAKKEFLHAGGEIQDAPKL